MNSSTLQQPTLEGRTANISERLFKAVMCLTGISEAILGLAIVFFAGSLQLYFSTGILSEPLYLRILGMMDFYIGVTYFQISRDPGYFHLLNKRTSYLRLCLSALFLVEGVFLLEDRVLRVMYQSLAAFDLFLFVIQTLYIKRTNGDEW